MSFILSICPTNLDAFSISIKTGFGFGLTSGVITTLGMMLGLYSTTHSKIAIIAGILSIAVADAFSDSMGIHISQEVENHHSKKEVWEATVSTFLGKFIFSLMFILPIWSQYIWVFWREELLLLPKPGKWWRRQEKRA